MKQKTKATKKKTRLSERAEEMLSTVAHHWPQLEQRHPEGMWKPTCWPNSIKPPPGAQWLPKR